MIQFNELKVSPEGTHIIADAQVMDLPEYKNVYLNNLYINTEEDFSNGVIGNNSNSLVIPCNNTTVTTFNNVVGTIDLLSPDVKQDTTMFFTKESNSRGLNLFKNITMPSEFFYNVKLYTSSDITKITSIVMEGNGGTTEEKTLYDINDDGAINSSDLTKMDSKVLAAECKISAGTFITIKPNIDQLYNTVELGFSMGNLFTDTETLEEAAAEVFLVVRKNGQAFKVLPADFTYSSADSIGTYGAWKWANVNIGSTLKSTDVVTYEIRVGKEIDFTEYDGINALTLTAHVQRLDLINTVPVKHISLSIDTNTLYNKANGEQGFLPDINKHLFFITAEATGIPSADTPCGMDENKVMGVTFYTKPFFDNLLGTIKDYLNSEYNQDENCTQPNNFTNKYLEYEGLLLSLYNGQYGDAIDFYNNFFKNKLTVAKTAGCGCYGR